MSELVVNSGRRHLPTPWVLDSLVIGPQTDAFLLPQAAFLQLSRDLTWFCGFKYRPYTSRTRLIPLPLGLSPKPPSPVAS